MISGAIIGGAVCAILPLVLKYFPKPITTREGHILLAAYGAVLGLILGLIF
ncbi:hypothetical protein KHP62_05340 [Rhodobacteraceae bacterium NNCM2]|nr:hypothetical protein [Coraliihabitans acroporae]